MSVPTPTSPSQTSTSITLACEPATGLQAPITYQYVRVEGEVDDFTPGPLVVTPDDGSDGEFDPATLTFNPNGTATPAAQSVVYTPGSAGSKSIAVTNNQGLTNPAAFTFEVFAVAGLCRLAVRVRDGNGDLLNGCTVTAKLLTRGLTTEDAELAPRQETAVTGAGDWADGYAELDLYPAETLLPASADRRYELLITGPDGRTVLRRRITVPNTPTANLWELV